MSRRVSHYLPTIVSLVCIAVFLLLKPDGLWWGRTLLCVIFCAGIGHQLLRAFNALSISGKAAGREFAGVAGMGMLIGAILLLPQPLGWGLLVAGYAVPMITRRMLK